MRADPWLVLNMSNDLEDTECIKAYCDSEADANRFLEANGSPKGWGIGHMGKPFYVALASTPPS